MPKKPTTTTGTPSAEVQSTAERLVQEVRSFKVELDADGAYMKPEKPKAGEKTKKTKKSSKPKQVPIAKYGIYVFVVGDTVILHELDYMETWGTGYKRMRQDCEAGGYPLPDWVELGRVTRTVFRPHPEVATAADVPANGPGNVPANVPMGSLNERQRWFVERLVSGAATRATDIAAQFQRHEKTAKRDIAELVEKGVIEYVGARKNGVYRLKEQES